MSKVVKCDVCGALISNPAEVSKEYKEVAKRLGKPVEDACWTHRLMLERAYNVYLELMGKKVAEPKKTRGGAKSKEPASATSGSPQEGESTAKGTDAPQGGSGEASAAGHTKGAAAGSSTTEDKTATGTATADKGGEKATTAATSVKSEGIGNEATSVGNKAAAA